MGKLKQILASSVIMAMISNSAMAVEVAKYVVPNFSIIIGSKLYTLDYANDKKNEMEITKAVIENIGVIYIKTTGSEWINNSTGKLVTASAVDKLEVKSFNGESVVTPPVSTGGGASVEESTDGSIIFKSVDIDTNLQLGYLILRKGNVGTDCEGYKNVIEGYTFVSADTTFTGKFTSLEQTVTLNYRQKIIQVNVAPTTKVTGLTSGLTFAQSDPRYMLVEAVDEDIETTNVRVSLDGVEVGNSRAQCYVLLNTETLGGHILRINSTDKEGLAGEEQIFIYAVSLSLRK